MQLRNHRVSPVVLVVHPSAELFGSDRMLLESVRGLRAAGAEVLVALPGEGPLVPHLEATGAQITTVPMFVLRRSLLTFRGIAALARDAVRGGFAGLWLMGQVRPDAVYISTTILPQWPLLARAGRARSVSHVHEAEASARRWTSALLYLPHLVSHIAVVNSSFCLETIRKSLPKLARRAKLIHNGIATPRQPAPLRERIEGDLRILFVGRLSPRKAPDLVIEAASILRDRGIPVSVTILGAVFPGYEPFEKQLRAHAARAGIPVDFEGFQPDVWGYLEHADVLVVPSRRDESFGNTAVEGVLARRPVVVSKMSGLQEAVGHYSSARLVDPDDANGIACAIQDLVHDWPAIVQCTDANQQEAINRHGVSTYRKAVAAAILDYALPPEGQTHGHSHT
jgi:glycosyltransferase involved in cell wall biosynthesis